MSPIDARSRKPAWVLVSIASSSKWALGRLQHRDALFNRVARSAHRTRRIDRDHLAGHQPVKQMADGGDLLLDGGHRVAARLTLDPGGDVKRPNLIQRFNSARAAQFKEFANRAGVGPARVRIPDVATKNSTKRRAARSPATATSGGTASPDGVRNDEFGVLFGLRGALSLSPLRHCPTSRVNSIRPFS